MLQQISTQPQVRQSHQTHTASRDSYVTAVMYEQMCITEQRNVKKMITPAAASQTRRNTNHTGMALGCEQRPLSNILMP